MKAGWPITTLGDEIDLLAGFAFKSARYTNDDDAIRLLRGDNIVQGSLRWDDVKKWPADDVPPYDSYQLRDGDVVLAMDRPWVKAGLKHAMISADDLPCLLVQRTARLRPLKSLDNRFLMYLIGSDDFTRHTLGVQTGIGVPHISGQQIKDFQFRMPPLAEQRRIVGILDEAFEGLATAKANAEQNLQNARALFESHLQAVFTQRGEGWEETTIGEACILRSGTTLSPSIEKPSGEIAYLKVADMNISENLNGVTCSSRYVSKCDVNASNLLPVGTTIFPKRGGAILTNKKRLTECVICADLNIMGVIPGKSLLPKLLFFYFMNIDMRELGSGSSIPQINNYDIAPLPISFPALHGEQYRIVNALENLSSETQRLESLYQRKLVALDELKKSLLHRAFSGQL